MSEVLVKFKIAEFVIEYHGRKEYLHDRFNDFLYEGEKASDITVEIIEKKPVFLRYLIDKGIKIGTFSLYEDGDTLIQYYPRRIHMFVWQMKGKNNYRDTQIFVCDNPKNFFVRCIGQQKYYHWMQQNIFSALQEVFYNRILFEGAMSIHSASVIYNDKAIVFSASSGTGKSTQAGLWMQELGCEMLDGDVTVCREQDGKLYVYGLPWCGSSGKYLNRKVELGAIVFLKQAKENTVRIPNIREKISYVYSSTFSESLNNDMAQRIAGVTQKKKKKARIYEFSCNMETDAVRILKNVIDNGM